MTVEDFVKLPADLASEFYRQLQKEGQFAKASELHQAYLRRHNVSLINIASQTDTAELAALAVVSFARTTGSVVGNAAKRLLGNWKACEALPIQGQGGGADMPGTVSGT